MILLRRDEKDYTAQPANGLLTLLLFCLAIRHSRGWSKGAGQWHGGRKAKGCYGGGTGAAAGVVNNRRAAMKQIMMACSVTRAG
jgi:hypothetical protein